MPYFDEKERGGTGGVKGAAAARGVSAQSRGASQRQTGKLQGNPGVFIGTEEHGDVVYARYQAIRGTWISASLAERGYQWVGAKTAFGAYLGIAVDSKLEPIKNPDHIDPGLEYLIPLHPVEKTAPPPPSYTTVPAPAPKPYIPPPKSNQKAEPFVQGRVGRAVKDAFLLTEDMPYPSFELNRDSPPPDREPHAAVTFWLKKHSEDIIAAEKRFNVSRVAIAGIIAWEALENPQVGSLKAAGVGKMHLVPDEDDISWPDAIENAGKMPKAALAERKTLLQIPRIGILYIAAALDIICEEAEKAGFNLRNSPDVLGHVYQSRGPKKWAKEIKAKKPNAPFSVQPGGMGGWIDDNRPYLWDAVGLSPVR